jgi:hypothetical protein
MHGAGSPKVKRNARKAIQINDGRRAVIIECGYLSRQTLNLIERDLRRAGQSINNNLGLIQGRL